ncbi:MAG: hypothetical protein WAP52_02570 [Candidatus Sungiibacteriota bacterium]
MDTLETKMGELEVKMDTLQAAINKLQKTFFWTLVITVALFVLPLIGLIFVIPQFLTSYSSGGF